MRPVGPRHNGAPRPGEESRSLATSSPPPRQGSPRHAASVGLPPLTRAPDLGVLGVPGILRNHLSSQEYTTHARLRTIAWVPHQAPRHPLGAVGRPARLEYQRPAAG